MRSRTTRDFWVQAATKDDEVLAVNPDGRWTGMHRWTRDMLQRWTLGRMRAFKPRYQRCVDIGCGPGHWSERFATIADEVHGCELAPAFVEKARRRVPSASIECCDLREYRIPERCDLVYVGAVLMYVHEDAALDLLRRVRAALAPGALVVVREFCTFNLGRRTINDRRSHFSIHRTPQELCWLAELAGLELVELRSAPSIYGEVLGGAVGHWPLRALMRAMTLPWRRASHTLFLQAS